MQWLTRWCKMRIEEPGSPVAAPVQEATHGVEQASAGHTHNGRRLLALLHPIHELHGALLQWVLSEPAAMALEPCQHT